VVYKGGAQAATDLIAARVDFGSFAAGSVIQFVKEGQLKPLAVVQETRSDLLPDVAAIAEQGLPGSRCRRSFHAVRAGGNAQGGRFGPRR
jgi:tripartite-type tricarboxylate transporter receptor subunit TctC